MDLKPSCSMPFVIINNCFEFVFYGYWHFENGGTRISEDVFLDPDGLPHVLDLAVPLQMFLAGWLEGIIPRSFSFKYFFTLPHG